MMKVVLKMMNFCINNQAQSLSQSPAQIVQVAVGGACVLSILYNFIGMAAFSIENSTEKRPFQSKFAVSSTHSLDDQRVDRTGASEGFPQRRGS